MNFPEIEQANWIGRKVTVQLIESCAITHQMQMRVYKFRNGYVRCELCVNHHAVCEFYDLFEVFHGCVTEALGEQWVLNWDDLSETHYYSFN